MEAKAKAGEEDLSMEEILQSIRKIIADDPEEGAAPAAANDSKAELPASEVLELTEIIEEPSAPVTAAPAPVVTIEEVPQAAASQDQVNDILSKIDQVVMPEAPVVTAAAAPQVSAPAPAAAVVPNGQEYIDSLLSSEAATATANAFKKVHPVEPPLVTTPSAQFRSGSSVEELVMESLRPMLKSWLDTNLPNIVERIVEREIKKLTD